MVRLVDALVHGGGDDDDDDDGGGGYYYFAFGWEWEKPLLEGTLVFDKSVALQGVAAPPSGGSTMGSLRFRDPTTHPPWLPEPGEAAGGAEPANVVRGVVGRRCGGRPMSLRLGGKEVQNVCYIDKRMSSRSEAKCPGPVNKERPKICAEKTVDSLNYIGE
uniref:Uncharacterized protein n=1 Tax=Oryza sativa subsp. japonica TaxID=39947 RepID=Q10Q49_ORYSJ|nr:hypothetical protein LOC_Os03g11150 [Oryza sativa Japonica Group]